MQLTRGMDKTVTALVQELKQLSTEVADDKDLANVASVSAGEGGRQGGREKGRGARMGQMRVCGHRGHMDIGWWL